MTDPRAALADLHCAQRAPDGGPCQNHLRSAEYEIKHLAERGVLLVTEERLAAALAKGGPVSRVTVEWTGSPTQLAAAIFAALSGEVPE